MTRDRRFLTGSLHVLTHSPRARSRLVAIAAGIALVTGPSALGTVPRLVWNTSASAALGLYWVAGKSGLERGDLVFAELPGPMRPIADKRKYLPFGVPLIKHVAALPNDHICTIGRAVLIGGSVAARRLKRDFRGRVIPAWDGCRLLLADEIFLLNADVPDSFDGRYFGPTRMDDIIGRLIPLWTWPGGKR